MKKFQSTPNDKMVLFSLEESRHALYSLVFKCVIYLAEMALLLKAPESVLGAINLQGEVIPVVDICKFFKLPNREIDLGDRFIIAQTTKRKVVLVVDSVNGVSYLSNLQVVDTKVELPFAGFISGVTVFENNLVLINDLEKFLSFDEQQTLDRAFEEFVK